MVLGPQCGPHNLEWTTHYTRRHFRSSDSEGLLRCPKSRSITRYPDRGETSSGRAAASLKREAIYRRVLAHQPDHPDALHLLGVVALQTGRSDTAIELIGRAISINAGVAEYHQNLGIALASEVAAG